MVAVSPSLNREYGSDEWVSFVSSYRQGQKVPPSGGRGQGLAGMHTASGGDHVSLVGVEGLGGARWGHMRRVPRFGDLRPNAR